MGAGDWEAVRGFGRGSGHLDVLRLRDYRHDARNEGGLMEKAKLVLAAIIALVCVTACPLIISRADKGTERRQSMSAGAEDYDVLLVIRRRDQDTGEWAEDNEGIRRVGNFADLDMAKQAFNKVDDALDRGLLEEDDGEGGPE